MPDIAKSWSNKLKKLRQKIKCWAKNFYGKRKREKTLLQNKLHELQKIKEEREYTQLEEDIWIRVTIDWRKFCRKKRITEN